MSDKKPKKLSESNKFDLLLLSVMRDTPNEVAKVLNELGKLKFTAFTLGVACRYRGVDIVKVLVEGGAEFTYDLETVKKAYGGADIAYDISAPDYCYAAALLSSVGAPGMPRIYQTGKIFKCQILPISARISVLSYLCETADKTGFDKDELLFYAYFSGERRIVDLLKKKGAVLPEKWVKVMLEVGLSENWYNYCYLTSLLSDEDFVPLMTALITENRELDGQKLHMTDWLWNVNKKRLDVSGYVRFMLDNFDLSKLNRGKLMKEIISRDDTKALAAVAEHGWLKMPKKRDEMIAFATENQKTECTAWLLDFKNRTADLKTERERAERRIHRELSADPTCVTMMKKEWAWKTREDGTLVITGYKGNATVVRVPSKIGKDAVTAIGEYAFSPLAKRIFAEQRAVRKAITEVILPDSITEIGEFAFYQCKSLKNVNLPEKLTEMPKGMLNLTGMEEIEIGGNIKKIGAVAFYGCPVLRSVIIHEGVEEIDDVAFIYCRALQTVELPNSIRKIEYDMNAPDYFTKIPRNPFTGCDILTIMLHKGSYAEEICKEVGIPFEYTEEK